jgi:hypothetical protein
MNMVFKKDSSGCPASLFRNLLVSFGVSIVLTSSWAADITDILRSFNAESIIVSLGENTKHLDTAKIDNAFDGITSNSDTERVLMQAITGNTPYPVSLICSVSDSILPDKNFVLDSFTLYRLSGWDAIKRSPSEFTLEGWCNGDWRTLYVTDQAQVWDESTSSKTFTIPLEKRCGCRKFRFTITKNGGDANWSGFQELVFHGDAESVLVWNGGEGAKWNLSDKNWLDATGTATNWSPGAKAFFGVGGTSSIEVEGACDVSGIQFSITNRCTIKGGILAFSQNAKILAGDEDVIASEMTVSHPIDFYKGYLDDESKQPHYFPTDPSDNNRGSWLLLWRDRRLSDITDFTGARINQGGALRDATAFHFDKDGSTASVQFQCLPNALLCIKVLFVQFGNDIYGRVAYVNYTWGESRQLGDDFDGNIEKRNVYKLYDGVSVVSYDGAYGLYGVKPVCATSEDNPLDVNRTQELVGPSPSGDALLPHNASDYYVGDSILCFPGYKVSDLQEVTDAKMRFYSADYKGVLHHFKNDGTKASVQIQSNTKPDSEGKSARVCVKVEFTDGVGGVYARAVYAKYNWSNPNAQDFDLLNGNRAEIFGGQSTVNNSAFGVKNIIALFKGRTLTISTPSLALARDISGDCPICFKPLEGKQMVSVTGVRSIPEVIFGGSTSFMFAQGASLAIESAAIEESAIVSVTGSVSGKEKMRIGDSKCLNPDEMKHFSVDGYKAVQDDDGYIVYSAALRIIVR